jgi:hypothetical protein
MSGLRKSTKLGGPPQDVTAAGGVGPLVIVLARLVVMVGELLIMELVDVVELENPEPAGSNWWSVHAPCWHPANDEWQATYYCWY